MLAHGRPPRLTGPYQQWPRRKKPVDQSHTVPFNDDKYLSVTAEYVVQFEAMIKRVFENPLVSNIQSLYAQTIAEGAHAAAFSQSDFAACMGRGESDSAVCNLFLHDLRWRPQCGIPTTPKASSTSRHTPFASLPDHINFEVHVAVAGSTVKPLDQVVRGTLPRISPEEPVHALLWALDDVLADPRLSEDDKRGWVSRIRNVMYVFHKLSDHKETIRKSINIREEMTTVFKSIMRTPLALFMMIVAQKKELEKDKGKVTTDQLCSFYNGRKFSEASEISQKNLLDNVSAINNKWKAASEPLCCQAVVHTAEELYGVDGPFSSVLQIYLLCNKANKDPTLICWIFRSVLDLFRAKAIARDSINVAKLQEKGRVDDIDLIVYNHAIHTALLGDTLSELQVPAKNKTTLREAAKSAETWRNTKGYPDMAFAKAKLLDLPDWQKDFGKAECFFSVLVDQLVFHKGFDSALRQGLKLNKGAADLLSYGAVGAEVQKNPRSCHGRQQGGRRAQEGGTRARPYRRPRGEQHCWRGERRHGRGGRRVPG